MTQSARHPWHRDGARRLFATLSVMQHRVALVTVPTSGIDAGF
jgi:hypothetical protein